MLAAWPEIDPDGDGVTVGKMLRMLKDNPSGYPRLREALAEFCPSRAGELPDSSKLGLRLRRVRRRNVGGQCFDNRPGGGGIAAWFVTDAAQSAGAGGGDGGRGDTADGLTREARARAQEGVVRNTPTTPTTP